MEIRQGFAPEQSDDQPSDRAPTEEGNGPEALGRGGDSEAQQHPTPPPATVTPKRYLVPSSHWPDYVCEEHDGEGWEVEIIRRRREWALCRFINAKDQSGQPFASEWRRAADLIPLTEGNRETEHMQAEPAPPPPLPAKRPIEDTEAARRVRSHLDTTEPSQMPVPQRLGFDQPIPNEHTVPAPGMDDPLREPVRPPRVRHQPDRLQYASAAMAASYDECALHRFDIQSPRLPDSAFIVDVKDGADTMIDIAAELYSQRGEPLLLAEEAELRDEYNLTEQSLQRALMIATDVHSASAEFGSSSAQVKMLRELYAAAAFDAAANGVRVPYLDPDVTVIGGEHHGHHDSLELMFHEKFSGCLLHSGDALLGNELFALSKARSSPDIYSERQMKGPEWDTPKQLEIAKIERLNAKTDVAADDPSIADMQVCEFLWTGRCKRNPDGSVSKYNARCCARGDLDRARLNLSSNDTTAPVARTSSNMSFDAVACLRGQHRCAYDVPGAYLQGEQLPHEQRLFRPPVGARKWDERGVEILWLSNSPFYGQTDAGAIWNRTINETLTSDKPPHGCGFTRCPQEPSLYATNVADSEPGGQVNNTLYVDDGRLGWDDDSRAQAKAREVQKKLNSRYGIAFGDDDPEETHFLGANIITHKSRKVASVRATSYIDLMVKRYADGDVSPCKRFPAHWSSTPADETLKREWEAAIATRTPASKELTKAYGSLFGALLHAVKFRPEIAAALGLCGSALTFPTEPLYECLMHVLVYLGRSRNLGTTFSAHAANADVLHAFADSDWSVTRSTTGYVIMLAGAAIVAASRRQHCITMSSCEAELVALADLAIELLHIVEVVNFLGHETADAIEVKTDSKAAYDLCHRFTTAQNSRHVDRKMFKMRELRGANRVKVKHIPGETNPADLFTKILGKQVFEKHRKYVLNLAGDTGLEHARRARLGARDVSSSREGTGAP